MAKTMTVDEALIAGKVARMLTERDPFEDGEVEIDFSDMREAGVLRLPASCSARVLSEDPELVGLYEVTISIRKITR